MTLAIIISILVGIFILVFAIRGWIEGFLKVVLTTLSLVLTIVLASVLMTPITNLLIEHTGIRASMEIKIEKAVGFSDGEGILGILEKMGISNPEAVANEINNNPGGEAVTGVESEIIEEMSIPETLKKALIENNKPEEYIKMGVQNFKEYIVRSLSDLIIKIIVFITLIIAIYIAIRILLAVSKIITNLPVVHGINKFFGLLVGILEALLFVWLVGFIITLIAGTAFGIKVVGVIHQSGFLTFLYDNNLLIAGVNKLFSLF